MLIILCFLLYNIEQRSSDCCVNLVSMFRSKRYPPYKASNMTFLCKMLKERWIPSLTYFPHILCFGLGVATMFAATHISKVRRPA